MIAASIFGVSSLDERYRREIIERDFNFNFNRLVVEKDSSFMKTFLQIFALLEEECRFDNIFDEI